MCTGMTSNTMDSIDGQLKPGSHLSTLDGLLKKVLHLCEIECSTVRSKFQDSVSDIRNQISIVQNEIASLQTVYLQNVKKIAASVSAIEKDLEKSRKERINRSNDLIVSGIPYVPNENLNDMVQNIAQHLGYENNNLPIVYATRLPKRTRKYRETTPVLIQFVTNLSREQFFRRYLAKRDLSLQHVGFNSRQRVYINENLSTVDRQIWRYACKLRNDGKLVRVHLKNGIVLVKRSNDNHSTPIHSMKQLFVFMKFES